MKLPHPARPTDAEIGSVLSRAEADDAAAAADRLVGAVRSDGLGMAGLERTRTAPAYRQADVLLLDPNAALGDATHREFIRLTTTDGADVERVDNQVLFRQMGGVGAWLRYHHGGHRR